MSACRQKTDAAISAFRAFLHLPDTDHVHFGLGVAATARLDGDPTWGLLVGVPSSTKTEVVRAFDDVADARVDDLSAAGLLGWVGGAKRGRPTGLLTRVGSEAFATVADLSTLLAMSDRGARDQLYALLRRAYDGEVVRELGSAPEPLTWRGRITLLAAVTPAIDNYSTHADALGPRWLYLRLRGQDSASRRRATRMARQSSPGLTGHRALVRRCVADAVQEAARVVRDLRVPAQLADVIDDVAIVACYGRAAIEREGYGRREICGLPSVEEPPRMAGQLSRLARGLLALGLEPDQVVRLCRRSALDSMPPARQRVLSALCHGEELTVSEIARRSECDRKVARMALEEMAAVGLCEGGSDSTRPSKAAKPWRLGGPDAELVIWRQPFYAEAGVRRRVGTFHHNPRVSPPSVHPTVRLS